LIEEFWGLREKPFLNTPDSRFLFPSGEFKEALARLLYHIKEVRGGISLITGNIGCGKTFLSVRLLESLPEEVYSKALIINPKFTLGQFYKALLRNFGETKHYRTKYNNIILLTDLLENNIRQGKENILIIDEAQLLTTSLLEEVRLLTNYEEPKRKYLQIVLFAQPEFENQIRKNEQFNQRIQVRYHLKGLSEKESKDYIRTRLTQAGISNPDIFSENGFSQVYKISKGVPRIINNICENSLFIAFSLDCKLIEKELVKDVARDLGLEV